MKTYVVPGTTAWTLYGWAMRPQVVVDFALAADSDHHLGRYLGCRRACSGAADRIARISCNCSAPANATGAFNVLLKNHAGTTITTQSSASTTNNDHPQRNHLTASRRTKCLSTSQAQHGLMAMSSTDAGRRKLRAHGKKPPPAVGRQGIPGRRQGQENRQTRQARP